MQTPRFFFCISIIYYHYASIIVRLWFLYPFQLNHCKRRIKFKELDLKLIWNLRYYSEQLTLSLIKSSRFFDFGNRLVILKKLTWPCLDCVANSLSCFPNHKKFERSLQLNFLSNRFQRWTSRIDSPFSTHTWIILKLWKFY